MIGIGIGLAVGMGTGKGNTTPITYLVSDTFNRADNPATLGNAETGQPWEYESTFFYILGNKAYGNSQSARINPNVSDNFEVEVDITFNTYSGLIFRALHSSSNNFYLARLNGTNLTLFRVIAGTPTSIGVYTVTTSVGAAVNIKARVVGTSLKVYYNGVEVISVTDDYPTLATNKYCGMNSGMDPVGAFDNFKIKAV